MKYMLECNEMKISYNGKFKKRSFRANRNLEPRTNQHSNEKY